VRAPQFKVKRNRVINVEPPGPPDFAMLPGASGLFGKDETTLRRELLTIPSTRGADGKDDELGVEQFFENNPMSRLSLGILRDQQVGLVSTFEQKKNEHTRQLVKLKQKTKDCQEFQMSNALLLKKLEDFEPFGQVSFLNGLVYSRKVLGEEPLFYSKVILI
jgi:hypothetical protein